MGSCLNTLLFYASFQSLNMSNTVNKGAEVYFLITALHQTIADTIVQGRTTLTYLCKKLMYISEFFYVIFVR